MWVGVTARFRTFHENLQLTRLQIAEATAHYSGVCRSLNNYYYNQASSSDNSFVIGSWSKLTSTRPPRDIDLYFVLPNDVYWRLESLQGNKQSYLLQEVKRILQRTYSATDLRGDGQVVVVGFNRMSVEVVPAFHLPNGQYYICDTHNGGIFKITDPVAEIKNVDSADRTYNNNVRPLVMMMKAWQTNCHVPVKSFWLELVAVEFLRQSPWRLYGYFYYDWIVRDFFAYLWSRANQVVIVPGTGEWIALGDEWHSRVETAWRRAIKACDYEIMDLVTLAGDEWQRIFGSQIPGNV